MAPSELPLRYVCQQCGTCVATSERLLEAKDDVVSFSKLYIAAPANAGTKTVVCPCCEQALGTRSESAFFLRGERVVKRVERLEICICSLKQQEISELSPVLMQVFPHSNITTKVLQKAELRGFQLAIRPSPDFVVVVHRNEGRALLTDRNGFYHDVIGSAWQLTAGNVLVVLTRTDPKADAELYNTQLLRSLSTQGDQPTIGAIGALGRVLTWESMPSKLQIEQLQHLTSKAYYREPPAPAQGIPSSWAARQPQKAAISTAWCMLL